MRCALLLSLLLASWTAAIGQTTQTTAQLALKLTTEEGKRQIQATLTANGKPVENATVEFSVARTFGRLPLGKDQTLDDGTAQAPFPADLPGGTSGELHVMALVSTPAQYAGTAGHAVFGGAAKVDLNATPFPRALWAPNPPIPLILTIAGVLAAVWLIYAYVIAQLAAILKGR